MDPQTSLAELATTIPAASRIFQRHRLDFCCGGRTSLAEACAQRGLDAGDVMREIEAATTDNDDVRWDERPAPEIIDHILVRYHAPLREELPRLGQMAARVEERHAGNAACPKGLAALLATMLDDVESHQGKEEQILFPMIKAGRGALAQGPIRVMEEEHDALGGKLDRIRVLTKDFRPPEEACPTWKALCLGLEQLELDLMRHIHLENAVLFPKVLRGAVAGSQGASAGSGNKDQEPGGGPATTRPRGSERPISGASMKIDLAEALERLKSEDAWRTRPRNAVTLLKGEGMRMLLVGLHKGAAIQAHRADGPISVHLLGGSIRPTVGGERLALEPGQVVAIEADLEHDLCADEESAFLLTMGGKSPHPASPFS